MPHGCEVLGYDLFTSCACALFALHTSGSEDIVSFDDFMLLFSTGAMRLYSKAITGSSKNETISEK